MKDKYDLMNDMIASRQQSDFTYSLQPETQGELQFFGRCNLVNGVEYEVFVFPINVHESLLDFDSQFSLCNYDHADDLTHNEHDVEVKADVCMHYENEGVNSIFPSVLFQNANMIGRFDGKENFILPQEYVNKNQVYERGKEF